MEKLMEIRVLPQGPFYITISNTKTVSNGTLIMEFNKNNLKFKLYGDPSNVKVFDESFLYEDFNDFSITIKNTEIQFKKSEPVKMFSMDGNFTNLMFIRFSSYNPAQWTVQEGNHVEQTLKITKKLF